MSPATPGPLTVLLIAPPGDTALLADECRGKVPTMTVIRCQIHGHAVRLPARGDHPGSALGYICPGCFEAKLGDDEWGDIRFEPPMLVLALDGVPVPMGCDRALRLAIPAHYLRRHRALERREERARAIYAAYPGADAHPWVEGGSSGRQHDARYEAFNQMSEADQAALNSLGVIMGPAYQINEAIAIASLYADLFPGARVVLLRDGREVGS